jgi:hypothetical protein
VTGDVDPYSSAACFRDKQYILKEIGQAPMEDPEFLFSAVDRKRMKEWAAD